MTPFPKSCIFIFWVNRSTQNLTVKTMGTRAKTNDIWWNIKINIQKLVDTCGYELPTNLQNFTQKDLAEVKIFQKVFFGGYFFLKYPVEYTLNAKRWRMMSLPGLQIYLQPHVTLTCELLTHKVEGFMLLPCGLLVPLGIKIGLFGLKISRLQVW